MDTGARGTGDNKLQAYCFRLCVTDAADPVRRVEIDEPEGYEPAAFEILVLRKSLWKEQRVGRLRHPTDGGYGSPGMSPEPAEGRFPGSLRY